MREILKNMGMNKKGNPQPYETIGFVRPREMEHFPRETAGVLMKFETVIERNGKKVFESRGEKSVGEILKELDNVIKGLG